MDEPIVDPLANLDQAIAGMKDVARVVRAYYAGLVVCGFTEDQALTLTNTYQSAWLSRGLA